MTGVSWGLRRHLPGPGGFVGSGDVAQVVAATAGADGGRRADAAGRARATATRSEARRAGRIRRIAGGYPKPSGRAAGRVDEGREPASRSSPRSPSRPLSGLSRSGHRAGHGFGLGCPDWPLCHGQVIPPLDDPKAWIEWVHRTVAVLIGFEILALALLAVATTATGDRSCGRRSAPSRWSASRRGSGADGPARQQRRIGHSPPRRGADPGGAPRVPDGPGRGYPARIGGRGASQRFTLSRGPSPRPSPSRCSCSGRT